jgi:hypothetical protein
MAFLAQMQHRKAYRIFVAFTGFVILFVFLRPSFYFQHPGLVTSEKRPIPKTFVVASVEKDDTSWLHEYLPEWEVSRYIVDKPSANLTVPKNKGQEAMVFLT